MNLPSNMNKTNNEISINVRFIKHFNFNFILNNLFYIFLGLPKILFFGSFDFESTKLNEKNYE